MTSLQNSEIQKGVAPLNPQESVHVRLCRVKRLKNMHFANVFFALGQCRYENHTSLRPLMDEILDPDRLPSFSEFDITGIVQGTGGMSVRLSCAQTPAEVTVLLHRLPMRHS